MTDSIAAALRAHAAALRTTPLDGVYVVIDESLVVAGAAVAPVASDPFAGTALLVRPMAREGDVRVRHHVVMSAGSPWHRVSAPDHAFVGVASISGRDAEIVAQRLMEMADAMDSGILTSGSEPAGGDRGEPAGTHQVDLVQLIAVAIARSAVPCRAVEMVDVPWFRNPSDIAAARRAAASVSDQRIAQLQANRLDDGFYSTFVVRRLSKPLTRLALRARMSPNAVTLISFAIGIGAALAFANGERWALVLGAVLLQLSLIVDCVDGEVARATRRFTALGAWLDASTDRVKEVVAYAGLAAGAAAVWGVNLWPLALLMVVLQTTRHMTDYDFSRVQRRREASVQPRSVADPSDGAEGSSSGWSVQQAMELSARVNRRNAVRWAKRAIHLPIGERWLILSLAAALLGATWALGLLFVAQILAFVYVSAGRTLRTIGWQGPAPQDAALLLSRQADAGPIASLLARMLPERTWASLWAAPAAWTVPAALRFIELGIVALVALAAYPTAVVLAFWWVAVIAFHHYDVLYRAIAGQAMPRWITWSGLGWDGRTLLILVTAASGLVAFGTTLQLGIAVWTVLLVVIASIQWLLSTSQGPSSEKSGSRAEAGQ